MTDVAVIRTGVANLASVLAGLERLGAAVRPATTAADIAAASHVLLPGVGAFAAGMAALRASGLAEPLRDRVAAGRPTLAICLGMQLLAEASDESPGVPGLGLIPARVTRFPAAPTIKVPQLGWNHVAPDAAGLVEPGYAYYANSYRIAEPPAGWLAARTDHGGPFCGALQRGPVLACQFHPELSGPWGLALIGRWLATEDRC
jgi:glutamine amidotransferase